VPQTVGPTHPYIGASPGCWQLYGRLVAREYAERRFPPVHRLAIDAYAVQHPGVRSRQAGQSVSVHLAGLYLALERSVPLTTITRVLGLRLSGRTEFDWLEPPASVGTTTVVDAATAADLPTHTRLVEQWARSAWDAWAPHHDRVRAWVDGTP
jgi:hypothetical protein